MQSYWFVSKLFLEIYLLKDKAKVSYHVPRISIKDATQLVEKLPIKKNTSKHVQHLSTKQREGI